VAEERHQKVDMYRQPENGEDSDYEKKKSSDAALTPPRPRRGESAFLSR